MRQGSDVPFGVMTAARPLPRRAGGNRTFEPLRDCAAIAGPLRRAAPPNNPAIEENIILRR